MGGCVSIWNFWSVKFVWEGNWSTFPFKNVPKMPWRTLKVTSDPHPNIAVYEQEKSFKVSKDSDEVKVFPSIDDPSEVDLSVIVPAYNEELRLPTMLDECLEFLNKRKSSFEVIIVDDGSKDKTTETALKYVEKHGCDKVRVLKLAKNRGKGGAVRMGMLRAR